MIYAVPQKRCHAEDVMYIFAFCVYNAVAILMCSAYSIYFGDTFYKGIRLFCLLILCFCELKKRFYSLRTVGILCAFVLIYIPVAYASGETSDMAMVLFFMYVGRDIPFELCAKCALWVSAVLLIFVIASASIGIIPNWIDDFDSRHREYLGFRYALFPAAILFNITALALYNIYIYISEMLACYRGCWAVSGQCMDVLQDGCKVILLYGGSAYF